MLARAVFCPGFASASLRRPCHSQRPSGNMWMCIVPPRHMTPVPATSSPRNPRRHLPVGATRYAPERSPFSSLTHLGTRTLDPLERSELAVSTDDETLNCLLHTGAASSHPHPIPPAILHPTRRTASSHPQLPHSYIRGLGVSSTTTKDSRWSICPPCTTSYVPTLPSPHSEKTHWPHRHSRALPLLRY